MNESTKWTFYSVHGPKTSEAKTHDIFFLIQKQNSEDKEYFNSLECFMTKKEAIDHAIKYLNHFKDP